MNGFWKIIFPDAAPKPDDPLKNRLLRAVIDARADGDPMLTIAVGPDRIEISWDAKELT